MSQIKGYASALNTPDYRRLSIDRKIDAFENVFGIILNMASTDEDWNEVYDEVFGGIIGETAKEIFSETNMEQPSYYDPDTTYKEDVMAWAEPVRKAFAEYAEGRRKIAALIA